jgi:phosphoglycolate phosphatase-like HAD superfamily hydrolase
VVQVIVLFDLDGTLLSAGGADRRAMLRAFQELWGVDAAVEGLRVHGRTDPEILGEIFQARLSRPPRATERQRLYRRYLAHLEEELNSCPGFRVLPGVVDLLETLAADSTVALGLATGNLEEAARLKLRRADLDRYFRFGGYGSDAADRETLVRLAIERGRALLPRGLHPVGVFLVGDTVFDITAGKRLKIHTVAVATGGDSHATLAAAGPDYLLPDLAHPTPFLSILEAVREGRAVPKRGRMAERGGQG